MTTKPEPQGDPYYFATTGVQLDLGEHLLDTTIVVCLNWYDAYDRAAAVARSQRVPGEIRVFRVQPLNSHGPYPGYQRRSGMLATTKVRVFYQEAEDGTVIPSPIIYRHPRATNIIAYSVLIVLLGSIIALTT